MKKLITLLLFTAISYGQNIQFSAAIDARNAIAGSVPTNNKPSFNYILEFAMVSCKGIEVTIGYESFKAIKFDKYNIQVGYQFEPLERLKIVPSVSYNLIGRYGEIWGTTSSHLALGANLALRYELSDSFDIELMAQGLNRVDLNARYGGNNNKVSGFVKLIYKIEL
jgi:hypothetical protein